MFNKNKLKAAAVKKGLKLPEVAKMCGMTYSTLFRKMTGVSDFTRSEIIKLCKALDLNTDEAVDIFFGCELA